MYQIIKPANGEMYVTGAPEDKIIGALYFEFAEDAEQFKNKISEIKSSDNVSDADLENIINVLYTEHGVISTISVYNTLALAGIFPNYTDLENRVIAIAFSRKLKPKAILLYNTPQLVFE